MARKLYFTSGAPGMEAFKALLRMNIIKNCPVTTEHVDRANDIYGLPIAALKGKATRSKSAIMSKDIIEIPEEIYMKNHKLQLCIDIVYINGMTFLVSIDKEIKFRSIVHLMKRIKGLLYEGLDKIIKVYNSAGFRIKVIHADNEFRSLLEDVQDNMDIHFNYTNADEHEPYIERNNRTIKERCRTVYHDLPYKNLPKILIKHLAIDQV